MNEKPASPKLIDSQRNVDNYRAVRDKLTSAHQRGMVDVMIEHFLAEIIDHDIERLMATMVHDPVYRFYGTNLMADFEGQETTRAFYEAQFATPPDSAGVNLDRMVVGDDAVVTEGVALLSQSLVKVAFPDIAPLFDPSREGALSKRLVIVVPFEEMKMAGEIHYFDGPWGPNDVIYRD